MRIVICGSVAFAEEIMNTREKLKEKGVEVVVPVGLGDYLGDSSLKKRPVKDRDAEEGAERKVKKNLIKGYYEEIKRSDAILVINEERAGIKNYIGGNTFLEMGFAHVLGKLIYLLNPIPNELKIFYEEILAIRPVILNGDLEKIKIK